MKKFLLKRNVSLNQAKSFTGGFVAVFVAVAGVAGYVLGGGVVTALSSALFVAMSLAFAGVLMASAVGAFNLVGIVAAVVTLIVAMAFATAVVGAVSFVFVVAVFTVFAIIFYCMAVDEYYKCRGLVC